MDWTENKKENLVLALMLMSENKNLAQLFYENKLISSWSKEKVEKRFDEIYEEINNCKVNKLEETIENLVGVWFYFPDLFKVPKDLKKILEVSEKGLEDLETKKDKDNQLSVRQKIIKFLEKKLETGNDREFQKVKIDLKKVLDLDLVKLIEDITGRIINEKRDLIKIKCPFIDCYDPGKSFVINKETNSFYCFECLRGGGAVQFFFHYLHFPINFSLIQLQTNHVDNNTEFIKKQT